MLTLCAITVHFVIVFDKDFMSCYCWFLYDTSHGVGLGQDLIFIFSFFSSLISISG